MSIEQIDKQLKEYYQSLQAPYDALFSTYCEDNGIDDDSLQAELEETADDSILVDFDDDFPFAKPPKNAADRNQKIFDLINKCYTNTGLSFAVSMPEINEQLFNVTENDLQKIKKIYKKQCPVLWNSGMENDETFLRILAIGRKHNFDYLQHLIDDYFIGRVKNIHKTYPESVWSEENKHLKQIRNFSKIKNSKYTPAELAIGAVKSFGARCCPKLLFSNIIEINDSLEITVKYIVAAATWIHGLIKTDNSICPFQIDLCLGLGSPSKQECVMSVDDDDDDDDDDDIDEKTQTNSDFFDCIGDICAKLNKNNLRFEVAQNDANSDQEIKPRTFGAIFNEFKNKVDKSNKYFPQKNRFIAYVDRRPGDQRPKPDCKLQDDAKYDMQKDDIWIYEPPENCREIPTDVVPEWYISASRTSILPNMEYDAKEAEASGKDHIDNQKGNQKGKDGPEQTKLKLINSNITSSSHCKGALLTISFICKEIDAIKSYLYWNGQITRFSPEDIKNVFPKLFNMTWNNGEKLEKDEKSLNEQFIENTNEIENLIKILKEKMPDKHFTCFQQSYI